MQTYAAAHTHTHSFPHTCSPMGSGSADTKRLSQRVKGHPGRGQIRTLGFFSIGHTKSHTHTHTDTHAHTHTFSTLLFFGSVQLDKQGRGGRPPEPALKSRIILHRSHKQSRSSRAPTHLTKRRLLQTNVLSQLRGSICCIFRIQQILPRSCASVFLKRFKDRRSVQWAASSLFVLLVLADQVRYVTWCAGLSFPFMFLSVVLEYDPRTGSFTKQQECPYSSTHSH